MRAERRANGEGGPWREDDPQKPRERAAVARADPDAADGALTQLRAWLAQRDFAPGARLPAERALCDILGVSRGELRKALAVLEREGAIWRHVGRGTFLGARPAEELLSIRAVAQRSSPREVMRARLLLEPMLAREAALNATAAQIEELARAIRASRAAPGWRHYENADNHFHRTVAEAAGNVVLTALFDQLNAIRRTVVWGRLRAGDTRPPPDHHSFAEHDRIFAAIAERAPEAAAEAMRAHLATVEARLLAGGGARGRSEEVDPQASPG